MFILDKFEVSYGYCMLFEICVMYFMCVVSLRYLRWTLHDI